MAANAALPSSSSYATWDQVPADNTDATLAPVRALSKAIYQLNDIRNCKQFITLALKESERYCFKTLRPGIAFVLPGTCVMALSYVMLASVALKLTTYVKK